MRLRNSGRTLSLSAFMAASDDAVARRWLADHGFSPQFGARPMARLIQTALKKPLAERILFGDLEKGGRVVLSVRDDQLSLDKV